MSQGSDLIALARSKAGQWYYTNEQWARMNPERSGGTDCSGFVRWCYGKFGYDIGTWTGDESHAGYEVARGHYPCEIPWDDLQPGDLILMTATYWNNYEFNEYLCHIELYCGDRTMIGHPSGWGPQEKWAQAWMESYGCITWMVRRVFESEDDMRPADVWEYNYNGTAPGGNMYNCAKSTNDTVAQLVKKVDALHSAVNNIRVNGAAIDYDKLANAVADKLAKRLVS